MQRPRSSERASILAHLRNTRRDENIFAFQQLRPLKLQLFIFCPYPCTFIKPLLLEFTLKKMTMLIMKEHKLNLEYKMAVSINKIQQTRYILLATSTDVPFSNFYQSLFWLIYY